jgi:hypothetical protein
MLMLITELMLCPSIPRAEDNDVFCCSWFSATAAKGGRHIGEDHTLVDEYR